MAALLVRRRAGIGFGAKGGMGGAFEGKVNPTATASKAAAAEPAAPKPAAAKSGTSVENVAWPPNRGFMNDTVPTLKPGTIVDRYGREGGTFVSPKGTPFNQRSLPPELAAAPDRQYEVVGDLEVRGGTAAPWFGQPGGGVQCEQPASVADLISRGVLKPVG